MLDAYEIGVGMVMNTNIPPMLAEIIASMIKIDAQVKTTTDNLRAMTSGLAGMRNAANEAASAWERAAAAMTRATQATRGGAAAGGGSGGMPPTFFLPVPVPGAGPSPGAGLSSGQLQLAGPGGGGPPGSGGIPLNFNGGGPPGPPGGPGGSRMPFFGRASLFGEYLAGEAALQVFDRTARKDAQLSGLMVQGFTREQADDAYRQSIVTQQKVVGSGVGGNLDIVSNLMTLLQRPGDAISMMPDFAKLGVILSANGQTDQGDALMSAMRAGELRGVLTERGPDGKEVISPERLRHFVAEVSATNAASHGKIGPAQILQFLKSGGVSGAMIDDESLFADSMALQMAMGSAGAGTALQGLGMQFSAGKMSQGAVKLLTDMGVIKDPSKVQKVGMGQVLLLPGAMDLDAQQMERDSPAQFVMTKLLPGMRNWLHTKYGSSYDTADDTHRQQMEMAASQEIASRIPGGKEIAEIMRNILLIERDRTAVGAAMNRDQMGIILDTNPEVRMKALNEAFKAFELALGDNAMGPAISTLNTLTHALNTLGDALRWYSNLNNRLNPDEINGHKVNRPDLLSLIQPTSLMPGFSMFDRTTWQDPDAHWWNMAPKSPVSSASQPIQMRGDLNVDGKKLGSFVAGSIADGGNAPSTGGSLSDYRVTPFGASNGMTP